MSGAFDTGLPAARDGGLWSVPLAIGRRLMDYGRLLKPRVMSLVVFTGLVGLVAAPGTVAPYTALIAIACIAIGAGAAGALN
ncbi:MAG: hypothetical protein RIC83_10100, partial [Alphaproteobacteria bacterium]